MKRKLFTTNIDIATVTALGGLAAISNFAVFFQQYGIYLSIVALVISLGDS